MGKGRRPKPTQQKILEGNPGKRKIEADDVQPEVGAPEMPRGLSRAARREWNFMVNVLSDLGILTKVDGKALAAYCWLYGRWEEASKLMDEHGQIVEDAVLDKQGERVVLRIKPNPACALAKTWLNQMRAYLIEFGLTPASRSKLKLQRKVQEDDFDKAMNRPVLVEFKPQLEPEYIVPESSDNP